MRSASAPLAAPTRRSEKRVSTQKRGVQPLFICLISSKGIVTQSGYISIYEWHKPKQEAKEIVAGTKLKVNSWYRIAVVIAVIFIVVMILPQVNLFPSFTKPQTVITRDNAHQLHIVASVRTRWGLDVVPEFSADNRVMILPDIDGVHIWDTETGKERYYLQEPDACANAICQPNGFYDVRNFGVDTFRYVLSPD
jgi:hypothetical protein